MKNRVAPINEEKNELSDKKFNSDHSLKEHELKHHEMVHPVKTIEEINEKRRNAVHAQMS